MEKQWILVSDAAHARVLEKIEPACEIRVVREIENPAGRARAQDLVTDEPGRIDKGGRRILSAMDPRTSPHDEQAVLFAKRLGKLLGAAATAGDFDRLTFIAPPHFLGLLRKFIPPEVQRRIHAEINRDLAPLDVPSLIKVVAESLDSRKAAG